MSEHNLERTHRILFPNFKTLEPRDYRRVAYHNSVNLLNNKAGEYRKAASHKQARITSVSIHTSDG